MSVIRPHEALLCPSFAQAQTPAKSSFGMVKRASHGKLGLCWLAWHPSRVGSDLGGVIGAKGTCSRLS